MIKPQNKNVIEDNSIVELLQFTDEIKKNYNTICLNVELDKIEKLKASISIYENNLKSKNPNVFLAYKTKNEIMAILNLLPFNLNTEVFQINCEIA